MKRHLGSLALLATLTALAALTACSDDPEPRAEDPATTSTTGPSDVPGDAEVVTIVSGSAAGGEVAEEATALPEQGDLAAYLEQFDSPPFVADLRAAVRAVPLAEGRVVGVAMIALGCDVPQSATVAEEDGAFVVTPGKIVDPHVECLVPVTSVAVLDLPATP